MRRRWAGRLTLAALEAPPHQVGILPGTDRFPGTVEESAPRIAREVPVDPSVPGWMSTGLYAAPGEVIAVIMPSSPVGRRLSVRIGAHSDAIWHLPRWQRWPEITREFAIESDRTLAAAGARWLIYICSTGDPALSGAVVRIEGAVEAPFYRRGVMTA